MNCYLDSSVVLRRIFGERNPLREWSKIQVSHSSRLLVIECRRVIDRLRQGGNLRPDVVAERLQDLDKILSHIGILPLTEEILSRAEEPFTTPLGTLDGIHLSTALAWKAQGNEFFFATHDSELALAAKAHGFAVIGV